MEEYTHASTDNMEFTLFIVPNELAKTDMYAKGQPWEYTMPVKQEPTFEAAVWAAKSMEDIIKQRTIDKTEVGEKRRGEGNSKSDKKRKPKGQNLTIRSIGVVMK